MNLFFKLFPYLLLLIFINSCKDKVPIQKLKEVNKVYKIKNIEKPFLNWNKYIDTNSIEIIPLETTNKSLLVTIKSMIIKNGNFYCHDYRNHALKMFNIKGDFIRQIGNRGKGPAEYLELRDFDINNGYVFLLDYYEIHKFNLHGEFIESKKLNSSYKIFNPTRFCYINDNNYYLYTYAPDTRNKKDIEFYCLHHYINNKLTGKYMQYKHTGSAGSFYKNSSFYYIKPYSGNNNIYKIIDDTIKPAFKLDFGNHALPENYFSNISRNEDIVNTYYKSDYIKEFTDIYNVGNEFIYLNALGPGAFTYQTIINKQNNHTISGRQDFPYSPDIKCSNDGYLYGIYYPYMVKKFLGKDTDNILFNRLQSKKLNINEKDNPIIVRFKILL